MLLFANPAPPKSGNAPGAPDETASSAIFADDANYDLRIQTTSTVANTLQFVASVQAS